MMLKDQQSDGTTQLINLSPYGEWRAALMGLSGRDPVFFAQLQSETNNLPTLTTCIETTCLHSNRRSRGRGRDGLQAYLQGRYPMALR